MSKLQETTIEQYLSHIRDDYVRWCEGYKAKSEANDNQGADYALGLNYELGHKYVKVVNKRLDGKEAVHSFIVNTDQDEKFKLGDILPAASWLAPSRREVVGNILDGDYTEKVRWIGL